MRVLQAWNVAEAVARGLRIEVDPEARMSVLRRYEAAPELRRRPVEALRDASEAIGLAMLERRLDAAALRDLLDSGALPFVLVPAVTPGDALVVVGAAGDRVKVLRVAPDGRTTDDEAEFATLASWPAAALIPVRLGDQGATRGHDHRTPGRRFLDLLVQERQDVGLVYFYATLTGLFSLALPLGVQAIVGMVQGGLILQPVIILIAFVIVGSLVSGVLNILQLRVVETIQQRVFARLALGLGVLVPRLDLEALRGADIPEQMNRFFDVVTIQKSLSKLLTETTTAGLQVLFGLLLLTFYHPYFTLFGLALLAVLYLIFRWTGPQGLETSLAESKYKYRVAHWLEEMARSATALKLAGQTNLPLRRMDAEVAGYLKYRNKHFDVLVLQGMSIVVVKTVITGGLLILGSALVVNNQITLGQFVASEIVIVTVLSGIEKLVVSLSTVYDMLTSLDKVGHVTDLPMDRPTGLTVPEYDAARGVEVRVQDLSYAYPGGAPVLRGVSFEVPAGAVVAVTGQEGAGQSTLLKVLAGMLPSYEGGVSVNGVSLRDLDVIHFRQLVGWSFPESTLFEGTVEENLTLGRPGVTLDELRRALELTGLAEAVQGLPEGLRTRVLGGGKGLPTHVVRRLLFARALASGPRLLLLDDAFDGLEPGFKRDIVRVITDPQAEWTVVAASRDPVFLAACDWIYLLDEGRIAAEGAYQDLLADTRFRAIVTTSTPRATEAA